MQKSTAMQDAILIFIVALTIFTINLPHEFIEFQTRFALFAKYMLQDGATIFVKTYQGYYPDYLSTPIILIYICAKLFGGLTPFTAILPTAVVSSLILVFIYKIGALQERKLGLIAVLFALLTQIFFAHARSIALDQYVSLITTICFYIAYKNFILQNKKFNSSIIIALICGFLFRSSVGIVIPCAVLFCFYFYTKNYKNLFLLILYGSLLFFILNLILLLTAYIYGGVNFVKNIILMQAVSRIKPNYIANFIYCFIQTLGIYALSYPIAFCATLNNIKKIKSPQNTDDYLLGSLALWILIILFFFTIVGSIKARYLLSIVPATSILSAYIFTNINNKFSRYIERVILLFMFLLTIILCALITMKLSAFNLIKNLVPTTNFDITTGFISLILLFAFILFFIFKKNHKKFYLLTIGVITFIIININIIEPIEYYKESSNLFIKKLNFLINKKKRPISFYNIGPDGLDIALAANFPSSIHPQFIKNEQLLLQKNNRNRYFIAKLNDFAIIRKYIREKLHIVFIGKIGHITCVVFVIK